MLSPNDIRNVNFVEDRAWDLYEILDTALCRGSESLQGMEIRVIGWVHKFSLKMKN